MNYHDPDTIRDAFNPGDYRIGVWTAQGETVVDYYHGDEEEQHVASFCIRLLDDGGVAWTRAWIAPDFRGQGIYTHLHQWALTQPSSVILAEGEQTEMYKRSGYEEVAPGVLEIREESSRHWLQNR